MKRYGGRFSKRRRFSKKRRFTKKKTTRTVKRRFKAKRPMRRTGRKLFRNLRGVGNFYSRKYVFQVTEQPIDLFFNGKAGNKTVLGDFDLQSLGATGQNGVQKLSEISAIGELFEYARVSKARMFWRTSGDKTNARYNLDASWVGLGAGAGISAGNIGNTTGGVSGDFCGTYPHDANQAPFYTNTSGTQSSAFTTDETYSRVVAQRGFRPGSVWGGTRSFKPSILRQNIDTWQVRAAGNNVMATATEYRKVYNKWIKTNSPMGSINIVATNRNVFDTVRYNGINLSIPQVGCYTMVANASAATTVNPTFGNGDYFMNVWLEVEIQWKNALSALSNPDDVPTLQQQEPINDFLRHKAAQALSGASTVIDGPNGDGPPLPKLGRFSEAADAVVAGMNILSRMKRD